MTFFFLMHITLAMCCLNDSSFVQHNLNNLFFPASRSKLEPAHGEAPYLEKWDRYGIKLPPQTLTSSSLHLLMLTTSFALSINQLNNLQSKLPLFGAAQPYYVQVDTSLRCYVIKDRSFILSTIETTCVA